MKKEFDFSWIFQDPLRRVLDEGIVWEARPLLKLSCFQVLNVNRWMPGTVDFSAGCAIFTREDPSLLPRTRTNLWGLEEWWTDDFKMKQMLKMSKDLYITLLSHLLFITFYIQIFGSKHVCDQLWDLKLSDLSLFCLEGDESNEAEGRWSHEEPKLRPLVKRGCLTSVASPGVSIHLFRPFGYYTWKSRHWFCERFWLGHGSCWVYELHKFESFEWFFLNSFIRAQGVLVTLDNRRLYALQRFALQEWPTPCLVRALCVDELTPTRQDLMMKWWNTMEMRFLESDAGGCGLHGYFAASLMNEDECI